MSANWIRVEKIKRDEDYPPMLIETIVPGLICLKMVGHGDKWISIPIDARRGMRGREKPIASPVSG